MVATSVHAAGADDVRAGGAGEHADAAGDRDHAHGVMGLLLPLLRGPSVDDGSEPSSHQGAAGSDRVAHDHDPQLEPAGC
jgi:hypothetical protein